MKFLFLILLCNLGLAISRDVTLDVAMMEEQPKRVESEISAFDQIADVNSETANLMPPNFDRKSDGLFQYDIMLNDWAHEKVFGRDPDRQYGASSNFRRLWPDGVVYYTYDDSIASEAGGKTLSVIEQAITVYHEKSCIKFLKRTTEDHYIEFHKGSGCWSLIGRVGGKQQISLGYGCEVVGIALHEMLHALGFWHEQSRPDRDQYVTIVFDNVKEGMADQFKMYATEIDSLGSPYDYRSVMHYGDRSFSKDPRNLKTILVKDPNFSGEIGQRTGLSARDIEQLQKLYKCADTQVSVDGQWGAWSSWSSCDATCGGGREIRSRSCNSPAPFNGGKTCSGSSTETQTCNTKACPGPVECDFDESFCLWKNIVNDNMDWKRLSGPTPSADTGPTSDHTSSLGSYVYIETSSPTQPDYTAVLQSSILSAKIYSRCLTFYYHMYGASIGELNIYMKYGEVANLVWTLKGGQGNSWKQAAVQIPPTQNDVQILVEGVRGGSYQGDIALDDFKLQDSYCITKPTNAAVRPPTTATPDIQTTTTSPATPKTTLDPSFHCDFENTSPQCQWGNMNSYDTMDWSVNSGSTSSSGTGPSTDSTYLYMEASSPAVESDKAWLLSPELLLVSSINPKCFQFDYHMLGDGMGELNVFFYNGVTSTINKHWSLKGNQGSNWLTGQVEFPVGSNQRIIIEAVRGKSFASDIAIDNLRVIDGSCVILPLKATIQQDRTTPTTTTAPATDQEIRIEVVSEGCADSVVRQRTAAKRRQNTTRRRRRTLLDWKNFMTEKAKKALNKGKKFLKELEEELREETKRNANSRSIYKKIIDHTKKRVVTYLEKTMNKFNPKTKAIDQTTTTRDATSQLQNDCTLARSSIRVNGVEYSPLKPGHNVVAIDGKTGKVIGETTYSTKTNMLAATSVGDDLKKLPDDTIIVIATQDSVLPQFIGETELQKIGAVPPYVPGKQGSWAFIGYKGKRKVDWIRQNSQSKGNGPSRVSATIPLLKGPVTGGGGTTTTTTKTITTITVLQNAREFKGSSFIPVPMEWSARLNFGAVDYTISLWFQTSSGGTLLSKLHPSIQTYDKAIKTVFVESGFLNIKLSEQVYKILKPVSDGAWHHLAITVKQASPSDILKVYVDGVLSLSKLIQSIPDSSTALVNIGKTTENYPGNTYFIGLMKNIIYKNQAANEDEIKALYQQ